MRFHLLRGQPIIPSKINFILYEMRIGLSNALDLSTKEALTDLGMDLAIYGRLSYGDHRGEYPQPQQISEVAHFHGHDGLIVPSARAECHNIVVFCDRIDPDQIDALNNHGTVAW
jgi:RES domain-containing protein